MIVSRKIRIYPNQEQVEKFWDYSGACRRIWNRYLRARILYYNLFGKKLTWQTYSKQVTKLKKRDRFSWLDKIPVNVWKPVLKDLDKAYDRFFKKGGFPKFKSRKRSRIGFYLRGDRMMIGDGEVSFYAQTIGTMKSNGERHEAQPINPKVTFDGKFWYLSYGYECESQAPKLSGSIGIDLGLKELAVLSTGQRFKNINKSHGVKKLERRKKFLERRRSRKWNHHKVDTGRKNKDGQPIYRYNHTQNTDKLTRKINRIQRKLNHIRDTHIHTITKQIVAQHPEKLVIEDLNVQGMMKNQKLAKHISRAKFGEFKRQLKYKADLYLGIEVTMANRWFASTQTCSKCGHVKYGNDKLNLKQRVYKCDCGNVIDRDLNAAINLANYND